MKVRNAKSYSDLSACIALAAKGYTDSLFPLDESYAYNNLCNLFNNKAMIKMFYMDNKLVAWGCGVISAPYLHSREKEASQMYFQTSLKGFSAVKVFQAYHEELINFGKANNVNKCTSTSLMDNWEVFYKILERDGWVRKGSIMVYILNKLNKPLARQAHTVQQVGRGFPTRSCRKVPP